MSEHGRNGWENAQLKDLGTWSGGGTPSKGRNEFWKDGLVPWVSPKDMKRLFIDEAIDRITESAIDESAVKLIPENSVLMVTRSGILAHTFPVCINTVSVTVNQDIKALTPHNGISYRYLAYGLRAFGNTILRDCSKDGTTVASVDTEALHSFHFPLAPHPEQHRIVEAVESYLTRLDDAVATLERLQRNLKRYRASVLKAAVEGRLVPTEAELARRENREYEPASVLLTRILKERKHRFIEDAAEKGRAKAEAKAKSAGKTWTDDDDEKTLAAERAKAARKYREPTAPDASQLPELPEGWCWATTEQMCWRITSGSRDWSKYYDKGTAVFLMAQNIRSGFLDLAFIQNVDPPADDASRRRTQVEEDDLLVTIVGANTGQVCRVPNALPEHFVCQSVALMRPVVGGMSEYLNLYLNSPPGTAVYESYMYGQGRPHLSFDQLRETPVPLPPSAEAVRLTASVSNSLSLASHAGDTVSLQKIKALHLRQSILKWAFEGKLVDQDPNDEPASALLERIKAERSASKPSTKAGRSRRRRKTA